MLRVNAVTRSFYGVDVLRGVDLAFPAGQITGLIGPNGAGKSTLFNVISGFYKASSGSILFDGADTTHCSPADLVRKGLVRTFQLARGFPKLSVFQHLMLYGRNQPGENLLDAVFRTGRSRRREQELAASALRIADRLRLSPVLDNPVTMLSGGQKKLVEIARSLMADPKLILLDEPMAGVNPTLADEICDHILALNREGMSVCIVEHDMKLIRRLCHSIIVMAQGRTLTSGTFAEVAANADVQEAYLGSRR